KPNSSVAPWTRPPRTPPPASHMLKPRLWWSRPLPCAVGVRPNSPPQITSVSSSRPRCFRSVKSHAIGWSLAWAGRRGVRVVPVGVRGMVGAVGDLRHAHAALRHAAGDQAGVGELAAAVAPPRRLRLGAQVEHVQGLELHAEGDLQRLDARLQLAVGAALFAV